MPEPSSVPTRSDDIAPADRRAAARASALPPLLDRRLVFVTGKGGVGKSTVAAALGLIASRHGRRTIIAEVARRDDVSRALGRDTGNGGFKEIELGPGLFSISIDPERAMAEYLIEQLPLRALAELLSSSRSFGYFAAATPGMRELLTIGKVWELSQPQRRTRGADPYDLVIADAPATGHGVAFLAAPRTFANAAQVGPIARQGAKIHAMLCDPRRTGVVAVTTAEEMAVTETMTLAHELRRRMGIELDRVVVNELLPRRYAPREAAAMRAALAEPPAGAPRALRAALTAALSEHVREHAQRAQVARLRRATGRAPAPLPRIFATELGPAQLDDLAGSLEAQL